MRRYFESLRPADVSKPIRGFTADMPVHFGLLTPSRYGGRSLIGHVLGVCFSKPQIEQNGQTDATNFCFDEWAFYICWMHFQRSASALRENIE